MHKYVVILLFFACNDPTQPTTPLTVSETYATAANRTGPSKPGSARARRVLVLGRVLVFG